MAIALSPLAVTDCLAVALAIVPTGWGIISVSYLTSLIRHLLYRTHFHSYTPVSHS